MKTKLLFIFILLTYLISAQTTGGSFKYNTVIGNNYDADPLKIFYNEFSREIWLFAKRDLENIDRNFTLFRVNQFGNVGLENVINNNSFTTYDVIEKNAFYDFAYADLNLPSRLGSLYTFYKQANIIDQKDYFRGSFLLPYITKIKNEQEQVLFIGKVFNKDEIAIFECDPIIGITEHYLDGIFASDFYDVEILEDGEMLLLAGEKNTTHPSFKLIHLNANFEVINILEFPWYRENNKMFIVPFGDASTFLIYSEKRINGGQGLAVNKSLELQWFLDFDEFKNVVSKSSFLQGPANTLYFVRSAQDNPSIPFTTYFHRLLDNGISFIQKEVPNYSTGFPWRLIEDLQGNLLAASQTDFGQGQLFEKDPILLKWDEEGNLLNSWDLKEPGDFELRDFIAGEDGDYYLLGTQVIDDEPVKTQLIRVGNENFEKEEPVTIQVFRDLESNCRLDSTDAPFRGALVRIFDKTEKFRLADENGLIYYSPEDSVISLQVIPPHSSWETCNSQAISFNIPSGSRTFIPLLLQSTENCPVLDLSVSLKQIEPCDETSYIVSIKNTGTIKAEDVSLLITYDPRLSVTDSFNAIFQNGNTIEYGYLYLEPNESQTLLINFDTDCDISTQDILCTEFDLRATNDCTGGNQRQFAYQNKCGNSLIIGSPLKRGYENGVETRRFVKKDSFVDYNLYFKNETGNTLQQLIIRDKLEPEMDISTLRVPWFPYNYSLEIIEERTLEFTFPNINLLPNEDLNVQYSIKPKSTLQNGDTFSNQATFITYNDEKRTNKLTLQIGERSGTSNPDLDFNLTLYPNPTQGTFHLETDIPTENLSLKIVHVSGQVFYQGPFKKMIDQNSLPLPEGSYIITCLKDGKPILSKQLLVF